MPSHSYHNALQGYPDCIYYDGCQECESRASRSDCGIAALDASTFLAAWTRARRLQVEGLPYVSDAEHRLLRVLGAVATHCSLKGGEKNG